MKQDEASEMLAKMEPVYAENAAGMLRALANPSRLMILCNLVQGEKIVGELNADLALSQSALSQHLARLRKDGLVATHRESQHIYLLPYRRPRCDEDYWTTA